MNMITHSVEISRPPKEVFAYLDQLERHGEWQSAIVDVKVQTDGPTGVGSRATETRKVPGGARQFTYEITEYDAPWRVAFRGIDGSIRPIGKVRVQPLEGQKRSRVTLELELEPHGFGGKLIAPLARRDAAKRIPQDHAKLKQLLEAGA
jgi:uncharacterized membrane protein